MRILCAAISGPGHIFPIIAVARALAARGHDVVIGVSNDKTSHAADAGLEATVLPAVPWKGPTFAPYTEALRLARAFESSVPPLKLDAVIVDGLALGVAFACEKAGVPWATLYPHALPLPSRDLPPFGAGRRPGATWLGRRRDVKSRARQEIDLARARDDCNDARAAFGLARSSHPAPYASPGLIMAATFPSLEPPRSDWPSHAIVTGPCLWEPPGEPPPIPPGDGPLVLVAASTAHEGPLIAHAVPAALRLGARVVVTSGASSVPVSDLRVSVVQFAPHEEIVSRADAVVCNAGHGILARALRAGVPVVAVPQHGDQKENAARAARAGAAVATRDARKSGRALAKVLGDPSYRRAAEAIAAGAPDGPVVAAAAVERWLGAGQK